MPDPKSQEPAVPKRSRGPAPLVTSLTRAERARREQIRGLKRLGPSFLITALLHGAALYYLWHLALPAGEEVRELRIEARLIDDAIEPLLQEEDEPEELEELVIVDEPVVTEFEPAESEVLVESPLDPLLGLGGSGGGRGVRGRSRGDNLSRFEDVVGGGGEMSAFGQYVSSVRERGLDVVFVVDATASMGRFLEQARAAIDDIIGDLSEIIPSQRVGMVAYRDVEDAWLTRFVDITDDRYHVQTFLLDLRPVGGGDFEEAVDEGLRVAFDRLAWRPDSKRVVIVVGDAPAHPEDEQKMLADVRSFVRTSDASLSVLYTGTDPEIRETQRDRDTRRSMERLVNSGNGFMAELGDEASKLRGDVLEMSFGRRWFEDVERLLSLREVDRKQKILEDKLEREDRAWFVRQLKRDPRPSIVDGCMALWDRTIGEAVLEVLFDPEAERGDRHACLYIAKRRLDPDAAIDVDVAMDEQQGMVDRLQRKLARVPRAGPEPGVVLPPTPGPRASEG